jgi:hypothetical protein
MPQPPTITPTGITTAPSSDQPADDQISAAAGTGERGTYQELAVNDAVADATADRRTVNRRERRERGAITAEYAIAIVSACALGGVLISIVRSPGMQNAFKTIINYALKLAGVEGVHL